VKENDKKSDYCEIIRDSGKGSVTIKVFIQPRASRNRFVGIHGGELKFAITAPPVENAANKMICRIIAEILSVPMSNAEIISGTSSRHKLISVKGRTVMEASASIEKIISAGWVSQ